MMLVQTSDLYYSAPSAAALYFYLVFLPLFPDAQKGVESAVYFPLECRVDLSSLRTAEGCVAASKSSDTVSALEELTSTWCSMVEQILAESSQMRREADDTGPLAELEYWKLRTAKFTCLIEQIKSHPVRSVIMALHQAKSKLMKVRVMTSIGLLQQNLDRATLCGQQAALSVQ